MGCTGEAKRRSDFAGCESLGWRRVVCADAVERKISEGSVR